MKELGISDLQIGQPDYERDGRWQAADPDGRKGGANTTAFRSKPFLVSR